MNEYCSLAAPDTLRIERLLPGPIERVWQYLTESEKRASWLAVGGVQQSVGGKVEHIFRNCHLTGNDGLPPPKYANLVNDAHMLGEVTQCEPPRLLSYIWNQGSGAESEVSFELSEQNEKVLLVLTHRRVVNRDQLLSFAGGWHTHLDILVARLSGKTPEGFWPAHTRLEKEYEQRFAS